MVATPALRPRPQHSFGGGQLFSLPFPRGRVGGVRPTGWVLARVSFQSPGPGQHATTGFAGSNTHPLPPLSWEERGGWHSPLLPHHGLVVFYNAMNDLEDHDRRSHPQHYGLANSEGQIYRSAELIARLNQVENLDYGTPGVAPEPSLT